MALTIDYSSFERPLSRAEEREYMPSQWWLRVGAAVFGFAILLFFVGTVSGTVGEVGGVATTLLVAGVISTVIYIGGRVNAGTRARMHRFAKENGLEYRTHIADLPYTGVIFNQGHSKQLVDSYVHTKNGEFEIGNYVYTTGSGKSSQTHDFGFIRITLERTLPHILLDARENNIWGMFSSLPGLFTADQKLSLEGDFDKYFTVYAPKEYERDALYVLTPDIMQMLIDTGKSYDIEIIDNQLFIYSIEPFILSNPHALEKLFALADVFTGEFGPQTDFYADELVGDRSVNIVTPKGARLKQHNAWVFILLGAVLYCLYLLFSVW